MHQVKDSTVFLNKAIAHLEEVKVAIKNALQDSNVTDLYMKDINDLISEIKSDITDINHPFKLEHD